MSWFRTLSNWGRWGLDDVLGTLNYVTDERRAAAAALVRTGRVVSAAWPIDPTPQPDHVFGPPQRWMIGTGEAAVAGQEADGPRWAGASEYVGMVFHGYSVTHLDALSHYFWDGQMYNGRPASAVTSRRGATEHAVTSAGDGIVGRGILLDVAAVRGVDWLEPGDAVMVEDLEAAEKVQRVEVGRGDLVLLRTGYGARVRSKGRDATQDVGRAGWHVSCLPWLHQREVAVIGADTAQDVHPSGYPGLRSPVHAVGIVAMGLWLIDNCDLEPLATACTDHDRWEFLLSVLPLRLAGATGSPVNPVAMF